MMDLCWDWLDLYFLFVFHTFTLETSLFGVEELKGEGERQEASP